MTAREAEILALITAGKKYELLGPNLEQGMNSYAFRARHKPLDVEVFLKVLDVDPSTAELFREAKFLSEVTSSSKTGAQYVVRIRDAELLSKDFAVVAMEYVTGGSLYKALLEAPFGQADAVRIAIGVLYGVSHLHSCDLVHRDLKPANILLTKTGSNVVPKVGDFGSVARIDPSIGAVTASRHSALYVPPEGWASPSQFTKVSDLYQVGLTLYELVNGALPAEPDAYLDSIARREIAQLGGSLESIDQFAASQLIDRSIARLASKSRIVERTPARPYFSRALKTVITKAIQPTPEDRFQSATEFIGRLSTLSIPNWLPIANHEFAAKGWAGFDWFVRKETHPKRGPEFVVRRKRTDTDASPRQFRTATTLAQAFAAVETQED